MVPSGTRKKMMLLLMIMTPGIPEYLTGSTPITNLIASPFAFLFELLANLGLYSTGALLIREFVIRYRKGWVSVFILGCAYGIMEEGISVHTFFEVSGSPVGLLEIYGRYAGVDWVWAVGLTYFHAIFSIGLPLLLLTIAFPKYSKEPLLGRKGSIAVGAFYVLTVLFLNIWLYVISSTIPGRPMPTELEYLFFGLLSLFLVLVAVKVPSNLFFPRGTASPGRKKFFIAGFLVFPFYLAYIAFPFGQNGVGRIPPLLDMFLLTAAFSALLFSVMKHLPAQDNQKELFSLAFGLLTPLLIWAEFVELTGIVPLITTITLIALVFIFRLRKAVMNSLSAPGFD
ncbi:MAG: hypothetical protein ACYCUZ_01000 [Cuniculiplasma sp.]